MLTIIGTSDQIKRHKNVNLLRKVVFLNLVFIPGGVQIFEHSNFTKSNKTVLVMIWKWSKRTQPRYLRSVKKNTSKTTDATRRCTFSTRLPSYPHPIIQSHALLSPSPRNHPTRPPLHPQRAKPSTVTSQPRVQTSLRFPFERPVHVVALSPVALDV